MRRPFEVHENCYDCAEFYDGCMGWRASRDFTCEDFNRLPNVMPGTCGQVFPPCRRSGLTGDRRAERNIAPGRNHPELLSPAGEFAYAEGASFSPKIHEAGVRTCGCGAALPKGKRLCDQCRIQNRRQTKRDYMRAYMEQRRTAVVGSDSGVPFPAAATQSTQASGGEYCGAREHHEYQLYLAVEDIDHSKTKARHPQSNGICERFHKTLLQEFYQTAFRKKIYHNLDELQADLDTWLNEYNESRPHSGKYCFGKTPMQTFLDSVPLARDKMLNQTVQTTTATV